MNRFIFFILLLLSFNLVAQDKSKGGGVYLLTSEPTFSLKKKNYSNVVTFEQSLTDKKRRLGLGVYRIGSGKFFAWEGGFFYMPYSHYDDPNSWRASTNVILRLLNFFPFNVGAGFYYGLGSSKYSHSIFHFGSLLSARLRLFGFFIEGKFLKDFEERKGSNSDASLLYHSKFQEYQAVIGFTSEGFF